MPPSQIFGEVDWDFAKGRGHEEAATTHSREAGVFFASLALSFGRAGINRGGLSTDWHFGQEHQWQWDLDERRTC